MLIKERTFPEDIQYVPNPTVLVLYLRTFAKNTPVRGIFGEDSSKVSVGGGTRVVSKGESVLRLMEY